MRLEFVYKHDYENPIVYRIKLDSMSDAEYEELDRAVLDALPDDDYTRQELDDAVFTVLCDRYSFLPEKRKTFYF